MDHPNCASCSETSRENELARLGQWAIESTDSVSECDASRPVRHSRVLTLPKLDFAFKQTHICLQCDRVFTS